MEQYSNIYIVGIKGVAMANLAVIYKKLGKNVAGADVADEFITDKLLKDNNISYQIGFDPAKLPPETEMIIYSAAHGGIDNPVAIEGKKRKLIVISQAEAIGQLMSQSKVKIAVAGCHGKTTISSLLSYALIKLGAKPNYIVGTPFFTDYQGSNYLGGDYFVAEADEYGVNPPLDKTPKFHFLNPDYIICPNIDFDHPDVYVGIKETKAAFGKFFAGNSSSTIVQELFVCQDDKNLMDVVCRLPKEKYITFGFDIKSDYRIENVITDQKGSSFDLIDSRHVSLARMAFRIALFGLENVSDTVGVIVLLLKLGFSADQIQKSLVGFAGAKRRFELVYNGQVKLFDDYAHHPKEIETTIKAAKMRFPGKRIIVIFQPHTYSRTQALLPDFAESLSQADLAYILPIFPSARERSGQFSVSSNDIVKLNPNKLVNVSSKAELVKHLSSIILDQDILFTMGAGDVYKLKNAIIEACSRRV